jgi:hypothetical protein
MLFVPPTFSFCHQPISQSVVSREPLITEAEKFPLLEAATKQRLVKNSRLICRVCRLMKFL